MSDIVILDNFAELKRMLNSESFKLIEDSFKKERDSYLQKMLNHSTSDEETIKLKAVVNAMDLNTPSKIGEALLSRGSKKAKQRYPELIR